MKKVRGITISMFLFIAVNSYAWGPKGHGLVGKIAWHYLSESTRTNVQNYLGDMPFDTAANWMDAMRANYEYDFMKPWHFINFEKGGTLYSHTG